MYSSGWDRFVQTGQVCDYLAYKGHQTINNVKNQLENTEKKEDAGFCSINRNNNKIRTNR